MISGLFAKKLSTWALFFLMFMLSMESYSQELKNMHPSLGALVSLSTKAEKEFSQQQRNCDSLRAKVSSQEAYEKLSIPDKKIYDKCEESPASYWDIIGVGCSWYCGGGLDTISASSFLKPNMEISYSAGNIHDLSYKTAWIEGVSGYGIGESITYHFPPENPRITELIIVNGLVKSEQAWNDNARVKKLKMYLNNKPYAILNLFDSRQSQHFKLESPLGYSDRDNWSKLQAKPWWTIRFEIIDVYKGNKYDDTAITEIYFDGIDVH